MRRFFAILVVAAFALVAISPASAQEYGLSGQNYQKKMDIGAGWFSIPDVVGVLITGLSSIEIEEETFSTSLTPCTNPSVEIMKYKNEWFSYGASFSLGYAEGAVETQMGVVKKQTICIYPTIGFVAETRYFNNDDGFSLYGSWGAGASLYVVSQKYANGYGESTLSATVMPCVDIYPLCARWGEFIGVYAELGIGSKGVLNTGVFINF